MKQGQKSNLPVTISLAVCAWTAFAAPTTIGQELIYQEDFETDGEAADPQRYTTTGRDVFEVDRIRSELGIQDQLGPVYFAHNNEISYVGVPAPTPARRMAMAWDMSMTEADTSPEMLDLFDSSVKWLLNNKAGATIIVSPAGTSLGVLGDRLLAAGYTIVDDDAGVNEEQLQTLGDMLFHINGAASRGARATIPMLVVSGGEADDVLTSSIGVTTTFQPGKGKIEVPSHPAAGGKTGEFDVANGAFAFELLGDQLPANATILASFQQPLTPTVASIEDVDKMIAGSKPSTTETGTLTALDLNDASEGNWPGGDEIPGGVTGVWGMRATGKVNVQQAGTYTFATGADDGVRLRIDVNKNGFDAGDTVITDPGPHGNTITYGSVTFPATGSYDIQVVGYNSGSGGNIELSVAIQPGAGQADLDIAPENWELLGVEGAVAPVSASEPFEVTIYSAAGETEFVNLPLIMLLNGPSDTPAGSVFGGGPFTGQHGSRFFAGAGMNKWTIPDTGDRTVRLGPINVAGKQNVKLTIAAAGTFLDFEPSNLSRGSADYLEVAIDPDDSGPKDFQRLIFFTPPSASVKYVDDAVTHPSSPTRLGLAFKDVTYDIPADATDLVIEVRSISTWWNEIFAFDNIRVTAGETITAPGLSILAKAGGAIEFTFEGVLETRPAVNTGSWTPVPGTSPLTLQQSQLGSAAFYRANRP